IPGILTASSISLSSTAESESVQICYASVPPLFGHAQSHGRRHEQFPRDVLRRRVHRLRHMTFPLRYHVALALVGLNIISTAALIAFAYRASSDSLEAQVTRAVAVAASEREQALVRLLEQRQNRMRAFLGSVESLCGERNPSGSFAWERECVRGALRGFQTAEHADAADLSYGTRLLARRGSWP